MNSYFSFSLIDLILFLKKKVLDLKRIASQGDIRMEDRNVNKRRNKDSVTFTRTDRSKACLCFSQGTLVPPRSLEHPACEHTGRLHMNFLVALKCYPPQPASLWVSPISAPVGGYTDARAHTLASVVFALCIRSEHWLLSSQKLCHQLCI